MLMNIDTCFPRRSATGTCVGGCKATLQLQLKIVEAARKSGGPTHDDIIILAFREARRFELGELSYEELERVLARLEKGERPTRDMSAVFDRLCSCRGHLG